jgi:hypothetical protein
MHVLEHEHGRPAGGRPFERAGHGLEQRGAGQVRWKARSGFGCRVDESREQAHEIEAAARGHARARRLVES